MSIFIGGILIRFDAGPLVDLDLNSPASVDSTVGVDCLKDSLFEGSRTSSALSTPVVPPYTITLMGWFVSIILK